ncbi:MAG: glycosyltransferase family 1 protein, partial [Candidatus Sumerlaeota bacterium]|nr:glycosyltransferase family 1 protein [Candidatus Sumerlaeota bacterium]
DAFGGRPPRRQFRGRPAPCVSTQHGARPFVFPILEYWPTWRERVRGFFLIQNRRWTWTRLNKADYLYIAVSHSTKREIIEKLGLPEENITVAQHGVDHSLFVPPKEPVAGGEPFLFHVSQFQPVKNLERIVEAYALLPESSRPALRLIAPGFQPRSAVKGLTCYEEPVSDEELVRLYQTATGFVFPSLHEGFGMPMLEAMACGCPVITSNVTSCPEIAGDAALLVNPRSVEEIAQAMRRMTDDADLRRSLREKGLRRAAQFSWRKSAEIHLEVFQRALAMRKSG